MKKKITSNDIVSFQPTEKSSFISHVSYSHSYSMLVVTFDSGSIWCYDQVPVSVFNKLARAESAGQFFNKNIRNKYPAECLIKAEKDSNTKRIHLG